MRRRPGGRRRTLAALAAAGLLFVLATTGTARAEDVTVDRAAIRFVTPETGGNAKPRFVTERELGFFTRVEAMMEGIALEPGEYPERYARLATDRLVARAMLASLQIQSGTEPPDLPKLAQEARADLADRIGGNAALEALLAREGIDEAELATFLRDQVRAIYYIDKGIVPVLSVTEDALRETFRASQHPYKSQKFDVVRAKVKRWIVTERARVAEIEFLQGARSRIKVTVIR